MSLVITTDVQCDAPGCLEWHHGETGLAVRGKVARQFARAAGWQTEKQGNKTLDFCPRHKDVT